MSISVRSNLQELSLAADHNLTERARRKVRARGTGDARKQKRSGQSGTSTTELQLKQTHARDADTTRREAQARVQYQTEHARVDNPIAGAAEVAEVTADFNARSDAEANQTRWQLTDTIRNLVAAFAYLMQFQVENDVDRDAQYPKSRISHFGTIFLVMILDAILNSVFYGAAASGGLVHGLVMALIVSMTIVGLGAMSGAFAFRQMYSRHPLRRILGMSGAVAFTVASFCLSLAAASYRDALAQDHALAPVATIASILRPPTDLTFDALCLLIFSLAASWLSCWKGLHLDDVIPGYGAAHRRLLNAQEVVEQLWETITQGVSHRVEAAHSTLDNLVSNADAEIKRRRSALDNIKAIDQAYQDEVNQIEHAQIASVSVYLEAYGATAQEPVRDNSLAFTKPQLDLAHLAGLETDVAAAETAGENLRSLVAKAKADVTNKATAIQLDMEDYRRALEVKRTDGTSLDSPKLPHGAGAEE